MAIRPIFIPKKTEVGVITENINFTWYTGYAVSQKQKSIKSLHENAKKRGYNILEISTKSEIQLGVMLSAFNLASTSINKQIKFTVESAYQSSKVFELGGPYVDLLTTESLKAKKDLRLKNSGKLLRFSFFGMEFPLEPKTFFYDWLYINTLIKNEKYFSELLKYNAFSDIEFNPIKSISCQAYTIALFSSVLLSGVQFNKLKEPQYFLELFSNEYLQKKINLTTAST